ncbi:DUF1604-domain-containing protein [Neoconidiobolus thromboides FSU 785]|nr:DUF1604-domain-containing protein [Neoconidiobolus thromboides FSU 785]
MNNNKKQLKGTYADDDDGEMDLSNENYVFLGKSILEAENSRFDKGAFVPVWKQEARDERGRKRFHGAFTGGFSAGYFNTVGSKEGWKPMEYKSSKKEKAKKVTLNVEDFMDEEDFEDIKKQSRMVKIKTTDEEFEELMEKRKEELKQLPNVIGSTSDSILNLFVDHKKDSIGIAILKQMGWKPGYGIGSNKLDLLLKKKYELNNNTVNIKKLLLPPKDVPLFEFIDKKDKKGLNLSDNNNNKEDKEISSSLNHLSSYLNQDNKLDEDGDYYINPYNQTKENTSYIKEEEDSDGEEKITLIRKKRRPPPPQNLLLMNSNIRINHLVRDKCQDLNIPLPSFVLANEIYYEVNYEKPTIPSNFNFEAEFEDINTINNAKTAQLNFQERKKMLGDNKEIETYLLEKEIERKEKYNNDDNNNGSNRINKKSRWDDDRGNKNNEDLNLMLSYSMVDQQSALKAKEAFIPFESNKEKQQRYLNFLDYYSNLTKLPPNWSKEFTIEDKIQEIQEFQKAIQMYRPLINTMMNRFTSSKQTIVEKETKLPAGLITNQNILNIKSSIQKQQEETKNKDNVDKNSILETKEYNYGQFGRLNRVVTQFQFNNLLFKRFNIKINPNNNNENNLNYQRTSQKALNKVLDFKSIGIENENEIANETNNNDIIMNNIIDIPVDKPSDKLFKMVFEDSDEDDEDDDE